MPPFERSTELTNINNKQNIAKEAHNVPNRSKVNFKEIVHPISLITKSNPGTKTKINLIIYISFQLSVETDIEIALVLHDFTCKVF